MDLIILIHLLYKRRICLKVISQEVNILADQNEYENISTIKTEKMDNVVPVGGYAMFN